MRCKRCSACSFTEKKRFEFVEDIGWICAKCYEAYKIMLECDQGNTEKKDL